VPLTPKLKTALTAVSILAILVATLRPQGDALPAGWSYSLAAGDKASAEVIENLLLFIPLGIALALGNARAWRCIAAGALLSLAVEVAQQWIPGRDPSIGDLTLNTLGTAIGVLVARTAPRWLVPAPTRAAWLSLAAAVFTATVWLGTGWLLRPMLPVASALELRAPDLGSHMDLFSGRVLSVTGRLAVAEPLRIVATVGTPSGRFAPILDVDDGPGPAGTIVAADRTDLVLRNRSRSMFLLLDRPDLRARGALAGLTPGDTITITVRTDRNRPAFCLARDAREACGLGYTVGDGWKLIFFPDHFPPWALRLLDALWVGGGLLGVGLWARRHPATGAALLVAAATLALGPGLVGLEATPLGEWLGAAAGVASGWLAWRARNRLSFVRAPRPTPS
jgi:hypothetical protein